MTWATGVELDKAALLVRDIGHRYGISLQHLVPGLDTLDSLKNSDGDNIYTEGFRIPENPFPRLIAEAIP